LYDNSIKKHILAVCGSPLVLAEIKAELNGHFDVSIASSPESAVEFLEKYGASAVVVYIDAASETDFSEYSGIIEYAKTKRNVPVVFLAERDDARDEIGAFEAGASDYAIRRHSDSKALIRRINLRIGETGEYGCSREADSTASVLSGKTVLIAEDVEINREIIYSLLSDIEGLALDFALNGKEAVAKFTENPCRYSLILMDVNMPEMDGLAATKAIRGLKSGIARDIPIIAMTAYVHIDEIKHCLKSGMNDFIKKPMSYDDLFGIIAKHCLR